MRSLGNRLHEILVIATYSTLKSSLAGIVVRLTIQ
jgi:hypothetical protein